MVKTTVLPADLSDFNTADEIDIRHFKSSFPVRAATYQLAALPEGGHVETETVAGRGPLTTASPKVGSALLSLELS